jgi:hypothetical protein
MTRVFLLSESAPTQQPVVSYVPAKGQAVRLVLGGMQISPAGQMDPDSPQIHGLPPGDYKVLAIEGMADLEYANPAALQPYLFEAAHVSLERNGKASVSVKVIRSGN